MKNARYVFSTFIVIGTLLITIWIVNRLYQVFVAIDAIETIEVDDRNNVIQSNKNYTEAELKIQRLSNPRAGDIYLVREPNDSFSFFQIGNVDDMEEVPIFKGAYLIADSFLLEDRVREMEVEFPDHFDTYGFEFSSRSALREMNEIGAIQSIYRIEEYPKNSSSDLKIIFLPLLFGFLWFLSFATLAYLGIWLANIGKTSFQNKKPINKVLIFIGISILIAVVGVAVEIGNFNNINLLFRFLRNLGTVLLFYLGFNFLNPFLERHFSFYKHQFLLMGGLIITGIITEIVIQFLSLYFMAEKIETNFENLFNAKRHPNNMVIDVFSMIYFSVANLVFNINLHLKKLTLSQKDYEITRLNELKTKAELEALTAKTNPHFLYNSLNTIAALAKVDAAKTEKMALELSKFLKYSTNRKGTNLVSLVEEIEVINTYLKIEQIRFSDQLSFHIEVEKAAETWFLPRFLLQPLVENALKHGYQVGTESIQIRIIALVENGQLILKIKDSGLPFADDFTAGYGLDSVTKKLHLLFPNQHRLEFMNVPEKQIQITILQDDRTTL